MPKGERRRPRALVAAFIAALVGQVPLALFGPLSSNAHAAAAAWTATGSMTTARSAHTLSLLAIGKVLAAGGQGGPVVATAELYDPGGGSWTATGSMTIIRSFHTATVLANGKVLVAGGFTSTGVTPSAELYDPGTGLWTATGSMSTARQAHTATRLSDGRVLVTGGLDGTSTNACSCSSSAEIYDPGMGTWSPTRTSTGATTSMTTARVQHTATLLGNGKVLVAGGATPSGFTQSAELFDPSSGTWSPTGNMSISRANHTATALDSGKVLAAGGEGSGPFTATADLFDPAANGGAGAWAATGSMSTPRSRFSATKLGNGKVLAAGGTADSSLTPLASAELYDPTAGTWSSTGGLNTARVGPADQGLAATALGNGSVLVAGATGLVGSTPTFSSLSSAELYAPPSPGPFALGDVFVGVGNGKINHYKPATTGVALEALDTTSASLNETGMCFDAAGNLYVTNWNAGTVSKFNNSGGLLQASFGSPFNTHPESCVVDALGFIYISEVDPATGTVVQLHKFNAAGTQVASFTLATQSRGIDWIDLASDQCTVFYTSEGNTVKRFNVCTNTQSADFVTLANYSDNTAPRCFSTRIRLDGEVVVACDRQVYRLGSTGNVLQTYPKPAGETSSFFALTLDPDGSSFWVAGFSSGNVYRVDIATGNKLASFTASPIGVSVGGLAVFGEPRAPLGVVTGVAQCGGTVLKGATVNLFSGSVLLTPPSPITASTNDGSYTIPNLPPNATYSVRYTGTVTVSGATKTVSCSVTIMTNGSGAAVVPQPFTCTNLTNHTWVTAFTLTSGVAQQDCIYRQGMSTWFKVPIAPGQRVFASLQNPPAPYTLMLYKDISKVAAAMQANTLNDLQSLTSSVAPDSLAPDSLAPDSLAPDSLAPDSLAPDSLAPDSLAPDSLAPDSLAPDLSQEFAAAEVTAPVYSIAQTRSLLGASANPGRSPQLVVRNTWDNSGSFYIRVRGQNGAFNSGAPFSLVVTVVPSACTGVTLTKTPAATTPAVTPHTLILTNTATARGLGISSADPFITNTLAGFAARPEVGGLVVDLAADTGLAADYSQWDGNVTCPQAANVVADAIRDLVIRYRTAQSPTTIMITQAITTTGSQTVTVSSTAGLAVGQTLSVDSGASQENLIISGLAATTITANFAQTHLANTSASSVPLEFIVLAGGDKVIPFRRVPDEAGLGNEKNFSPPVFDSSESQAALKLGYFLSQDSYATSTPISRFDHDLYLPDAAIGRLVKSPAEMTAVINAYLAVNGVAQPTTALATGYDFLSPVAQFISSQLSQSSVTVDSSLIQPQFKGPLDSTAWSADQVRQKLFGPARYGVLSLNSHFSANRMLAADYQTRVGSNEIATITDGRFQNALILSTGCHSAYNIVNSDAIPGVTQAVDFTQAFARQGATLVGGTGYQYGDTDFIKYTELLLANVTLELRKGSGAVQIGKAINNAKRTYVSQLTGLRGIDEKSVGELTLYGLPMWGVNLPAPRLTPPAAPALLTPTAGTSFGLASADVTPSYTLRRQDLSLQVTGTTTTATSSYFDAGTADAIQTSPFEPVLPRQVTSVAATGFTQGTTTFSGTVPRGAVLLSATYADTPAPGDTTTPSFRPLVDVGSTEVRGIHPEYVTSVRTPVRPFALNGLAGPTLVVTPFQYLSNGSGAVGVARTFPSMTVRVYMSSVTGATALAGAPVIFSTTTTQNGAKVHVDVAVGGLTAADIETIFATYTAESTSPPSTTQNTLYGRWASLALTPGATTTSGAGFVRHYTGDIDTTNTGAQPTDVRLFVQAVSGTGLVSAATNNGAYYRVVTETATAAAPKTATKLALAITDSNGNPLTTTTYRSPLTLKATLTDVNNTPLPDGKPVSFKLEGLRARATTVGGVATAQLPANVLPNLTTPYQATAAFAEDTSFLTSGASQPITVTQALTSFATSPPSSLQYSGSAVIATLASGNRPLNERPVVVNLAGTTGSIGIITDGYGRVLLDTLELGGIGPGTYLTTLTFNGDDRYLGTTASMTITVSPKSATVAFNPAPQPMGTVTLSAKVTQSTTSTRAAGDLTKAVVNYVLTPDTGASPTTIFGVPVAADGTSTTTLTLSPAVYTVQTTVGGFFTSPPTLDLFPVFDTTQFSTGGGFEFIPASASGVPLPGVPIPIGAKANFGFGIKYQSGTTTPAGSFLFNINAIGFNFQANSFDWLVINSGTSAEYQGTGSINGSGSFKVHVLAQHLPTGDFFAVGIWDPTTGSSTNPNLVNIPSTSPSTSPPSTQLGGGSIIVH